jgi:ribonuclease HII
MLRVGIDESGTGAWAGPFTVTACMIGDDFEKRVGVQLNDSKKLSDKKRREMVPLIVEHAVALHTVVVPVDRIAEDHRGAWREAIYEAVRALGIPSNRDAELMIDGPPDKALIKGFKKLRVHRVSFESKADGKYPEVMAASIVAKTVRNDHMVALSEQYPEYLWAKNAGYGTDEHREAIERFGRTPQHRPIRTIAHVGKLYTPEDQGWWADEGRDAKSGEPEQGTP